MTDTDSMPCPSCGASCATADAFCEVCGTELAPAAVSTAAADFVPICPVCSADPEADNSAGVTPDGYCMSCGRKVPSGRDHVEIDLGLLAGVTDRGIRHSRNEDAMAMATAHTPDGPAAVAVVCDGVSSSSRPDEASLAAAQTAVRALLRSVRTGDDPAQASAEAMRSAAAAIADLLAPGEAETAPSATYLSAIITDGLITLCWVGDSRAYWLAAGGSRRLTTDDSMAQEMVASGMLDEAEAMASAHAHVITQWLGADIPAPRPHVASFEPAGPGVLLLCSDGLWNYLPTADDLASYVLPGGFGDPLGTAGVLLKFAIEAGGSDNITIVLAPVPLDSKQE